MSDEPSGGSDTGARREFKHESVMCDDCGEYVVVTRNKDPTAPDESTKFECGCSVGLLAAAKPDSWNVGSFL